MKVIIWVLFICLMAGCQSEQSNNNTESTPAPAEDSTFTPEPEKEESEAIDDERRRWQKPELVISHLGDLSDKTVADLGAGIGYFVFKLLPRAEKVIAIDVDKEKIQILNEFKSSLRDELKSKLDVRLSPFDNSTLQEDEVDIVLIVNTVAYLPNRNKYFLHLKDALKDGGKIVIVDFKTKRIPEFVSAPPYEDREYLHVLEEELLSAGFSNIQTDDTSLEYQYIVIAEN